MKISEFKKEIRSHYKKHGRTLPWRETTDPYAIWISEVMLQQTQVDRVIPKYDAFLKKFSTVEKLARASRMSLLTLWQGLGYNRRALLMQDAAKTIVREYGGVLPRDPDDLEKLPGIGHYTARAIATFAHNALHVFIETNIRAVYIHFFFPDTETVTDDELLPIIRETLDTKNPRAWYSALMDYGAKLKREGKGKNTRSAHYVKQKAFKGSDREIRGAIVKLMVKKKKISMKELLKELPFESERIRAVSEKLEKEGFILKKSTTITLKST